MTIEEKIQLVSSLVDDLVGQFTRWGKDGERVKAFYEDLSSAFKKAKTAQEKGAYLDVAFVLIGKAYVALKGKKWYNPFTWGKDPFKDMRLQADDFARVFNFESYKALRGL